MPSRLLSSLNNLSSGTAKTSGAAEAHVIVKSSVFKITDGLTDMPITALRRMGYVGDGFDLAKTLFIDTETTGLSGGSGTVAFLVGCGYLRDNGFIVKQYLMPDYSAEPEMLIKLSELFKEFNCFVHFNGKRFDVPLLKSRFIMKRLNKLWFDPDEIDLLYPARAIWKLRLKSCRLSEIENNILLTPRADDTPGSQIPALYFESIKKHDLSLLDGVIEHNCKDILTLTHLFVKLKNILTEAEALTMAADALGAGKLLERKNEIKPALRMYRLAAKRPAVITLHTLKNEVYAGEANLRLYRLYRRNGEYLLAEGVLNDMVKRKQRGMLPYLELAKLYEHHLHDLNKALCLTELLLSKSTDATEKESLLRRKERLTGKIKHNTCIKE